MEHIVVETPRGRFIATLRGVGEPVVFIQTALVAEELALVANEPALSGHRRILFHRRGYGHSNPALPGQSIPDDGEDCMQVIDALRLGRVHLVGLSYAGAVALQMATDHPGAVHTLPLIEPPPIHVASRDEFRAANTALLQTHRKHVPALRWRNSWPC